ncbi:hypothetical protein O3G_MSEX013516 [Manduca sexta]|uniref:Uncharacterized protein n=1 Tax=Manduca sexta TaxID=7130 RepID=A0A922CZE7_MANSE|nr:hypothetical protein O3G_MSEX013516 [Manduca sexta]
MRASFIFAAVLLISVAFASAKSIEDPHESSVLVKRDTIHIDPPLPRCVFYECVASCKQRRHSGGICTMNGCFCVG